VQVNCNVGTETVDVSLVNFSGKSRFSNSSVGSDEVWRPSVKLLILPKLLMYDFRGLTAVKLSLKIVVTIFSKLCTTVHSKLNLLLQLYYAYALSFFTTD
jgi:hypothetical protein